ncbi:MAG: tetratricopeptide repeat protein [Pseudomonadota bacterium]
MTSRHFPAATSASLCLCLIAAVWVAPAQAARKITCSSDDIRYEIDVKQLSIQYSATGLEATLSGLSVLGGRVAVAPKTLQQAAVATQKLNEFVKALATGFNSCAISKKAYEEGIKSLLPAMQSDGKTLESLRQHLLADRKIDAAQLERTLAGYNNKLERLARISGKSIDYERIEAIVDEQLGKHTESILQGQKTSQDAILARMDQLERGMKVPPPPTPQQVKIEISAIKQQLLEKADEEAAAHKQQLLAKFDEAEAAYNQGYALLERYRFAEAIPHLKKALDLVMLPDFYLALATAYTLLPDFAKAEHIMREGLAQIDEATAPQAVAQLSTVMGMVLGIKGDLDGALTHFRRALKIDKQLYGPEHSSVAIDANNIGQILMVKGDLDGALAYSQRALKIDEHVYGPEHASVATVVNSIGHILQAKGDLDRALAHFRRALKINEQVYGSEHFSVATDANNVGQILLAKGDLDGALALTQRALKIDEKVFGPEHYSVAASAASIGQVLMAKGDLDGALAYAQRALKILTQTFGPEHLSIATVAASIGQILMAKGDLDGALTATQRALKIVEKAFGPEHPSVATITNNIGQVLQAKGDLDGALAYAQRALKIDEKVFGPEHPSVARDVNNIGLILQAKGDLNGALAYAQRALRILTQIYGPDNPWTRTAARNMEKIQSRMNGEKVSAP